MILPATGIADPEASVGPEVLNSVHKTSVQLTDLPDLHISDPFGINLKGKMKDKGELKGENEK